MFNIIERERCSNMLKNSSLSKLEYFDWVSQVFDTADCVELTFVRVVLWTCFELIISYRHAI